MLIKNAQTYIFVLCLFWQGVFRSQTFLNGSFEINTAAACDFNLSNAAFNAKMANSTAYGVSSQIDIMTAGCGYGGTPQNGLWMVSLATNAGNTDAFTTMLSAPLVAGNTYIMTFYDESDPTYPPGVPVVIGISTVAGTAGTPIYTTPAPISGVWSLRNFSFVAPNNGQHVSISTTGAPLWSFVDNFCLGCIILPVELAEFTAECKNNEVVLNWTTMTEKNNDYFSIERSENGKDFIQLGIIKASGNSNMKINYTFTDSIQSDKQAYYRIKETDLDQSMSYSDLITTPFCKNKNEFSYQLFPNPANNTLNLSIKNFESNIQLIITNQLGEIAYDKILDNNTNSINVSEFISGIYFIQFVTAEKIVRSKFFKN